MKVLIAAVVGAIAVFAWGFVSWTLLPWHYSASMAKMPQEEAVVAALSSQPLEEGAYMFPGWPHDDGQTMTDEEMNAYMAKAEAGPFGFIFYQPGGKDLEDSMTFVWGFVSYLITALIAAIMLKAAARSLPGYLGRAFFVALLGVFAPIVTYGAMWIWMNYPTEYTLVHSLDVFVGWALAGLVMAVVIKGGGSRGGAGA